MRTISTVSVITRVAAIGLAALIPTLSRAQDDTKKPARVSVIRVPNSGIQPQSLIDARGSIHVIYFRGEPAAGDLFYTRRDAGQEQFSESIRVNSQPKSAIAIGTIRGGQLALGKGNRVHVVWNGSGDAAPKPPAGGVPMLYARMNDNGAAFGSQRNLMTKTSALDGGGTVAADGEGNVYVAWHARTEDSGDGEMGRRLWVARSKDDGVTFTPEAPTLERETGACGCCGTHAMADRGGRVFVLYRAATHGTDRDLYLATSDDRGERWSGLSLQPWRTNNCPMSSASLWETPSGVLAAWETEGQVAFAQVGKGPEASPKPISPPGNRGNRKHPAVAGNANGETILAWAEDTGWQRGGSLVWQVFDRDGKPTSDRGRIKNGIPTWGLPAVVAMPDGRFTIIH
jgi:hypothetical protein